MCETIYVFYVLPWELEQIFAAVVEASKIHYDEGLNYLIFYKLFACGHQYTKQNFDAATT